MLFQGQILSVLTFYRQVGGGPSTERHSCFENNSLGNISYQSATVHFPTNLCYYI